MILSREKKKQMREIIFRHLDGIATAPCAQILHSHGVLSYLIENQSCGLSTLSEKFNANEGYLNVCLRVLCSQGWLHTETDPLSKEVFYSINSRSEYAFSLAIHFEEVVRFIPAAIRMEDYIVNGFDSSALTMLSYIIEKQKNGWHISPHVDPEKESVRVQFLRHCEGMIAGPIIVALGIRGLFHKYFSIAPFKPEEYTQHRQQLSLVLDFFVHLRWLVKNNDIYNFTEQGLFYAKRSAAYGVTVSYLPTFLRIKDLVFGKADILWENVPKAEEIHVNRTMNVWGSGGAHSAYFKVVDEIILELFNRPLESQPKGFLDMGCGNGAFIEHIFQVIWKRTLRGRYLDDYPLFIIGADYNEAALKATRETLNKADIWAKVIQGDISDPDGLSRELNEKYEIDLSDLLNVRSFLDHNRIFRKPLTGSIDRKGITTGAFAFRGRRVGSAEIEQNLFEHFKSWAPYLHKFGLIIIELHTLPPKLASQHIGQTAVTAYDATHGFSDQYIVELDVFLKIAQEAGLIADPRLLSRFPDSELATISVNFLKAS